MSQPTPDARAVVRALDALTTHVKRIADHTAQGLFALAPPVVGVDDDAPTTADDGPTTPLPSINAADVQGFCPACGHGVLMLGEGGHVVCTLMDCPDPDAVDKSLTSTDDTPTTCDEPGPWGDAHACIRPVGHPDDHQGQDGCGWRTGLCGSGQHKPHPGFTCAEVDASQPYFRVRWEQEQQAPAADAACRRMETRTCPATYNGPCGDRPCARFESDDPGPWLDTAAPATAAAEDEQRTAHWHGACDGTTPDCAFPPPGTGRRRSLRVLLNRLNNGIPLTPDEAQLLTRHVATEISEHNTARSVAAGNLRHVRTIVPEIDRLTAELEDAETRASGSLDDLKRVWGERDRAQAAIERVREVPPYVESVLAQSGPGVSRVAVQKIADRLRGALDGTEQPELPARNFAAYQAAIARVALVLREEREHREQTDPSERQVCVMCSADHFAEIRDAIKGKPPTTEA